MNALQLKPRQPAADEVENWDDDDFLIDNDNLTFRSTSTSVQGPWHRRGSHSSHVSLRSELESIPGEERQVHLPGDDEKSVLDAIAAAAMAGIPLPQNVPPSALVGGTIKRLGGRRLKKMIQEDDWGEDLELPDMSQPLRVKQQDGSMFPEVLRQVGSSAQASPVKSVQGSDNGDQRLTVERPPTVATGAVNLERFRDAEDDDDFFGDGAATVKVFKTRQPAKPVSLITPPTPQKKGGDEDFENDFELPSDGKLILSNRKDIPRTPAMNTLDDFDWGEGSLGTRHGGTRRDGRSNRSSSASALSPSIASSMTAESEDETFDGLVLPIGPVDFEERLQRRRKSRSPERQEAPKEAPQPEADKEDFATGLDLGDGDVFSSGKLTLHRHVKIRETRPVSPTRPKTAVSLIFTNKPATTAISRLPRPVVGHERSHTQTSLEPVSESGGPILPRPRRPQSRLSGHSAQSSISSVQTPTTPSPSQSFAAVTPRRREVGHKPSAVSLRPEPTTTSAQLLRLKRSLPAMRPLQSPARPCASRAPDRPPSRTDTGSRPNSYIRPRTPTDRIRPGAESAQGRRHPVPFLPAGASVSQSHNINARSSRTFRRHDSDNSLDGRPSSRAASRSTMRSPSPSKRGRNTAERLAQEGGASQYISRPRRQRNFGDGHELDGFDDLPTSTHTEAKYMRQPITTGPKAQLRNKIYQNILPDRTNTPSPHPMLTPSRADHLPHFARDTAASRIARETSLAQRVPSSGPLAPLTTQRVAQLSTRANLNPHLPHQTVRSRRASKKSQQLQPHLIANLNTCKESKSTVHPDFPRSLCRSYH